MQIDPPELWVSISPSAEEGSKERFIWIVNWGVGEFIFRLAVEAANTEKEWYCEGAGNYEALDIAIEIDRNFQVMLLREQ